MLINYILIPLLLFVAFMIIWLIVAMIDSFKGRKELNEVRNFYLKAMGKKVLKETVEKANKV